ncbi:MAG: hypothetical protein LBU96_16105 [Yokenella regensburgei]|uniref:hypothetical protein n=1 Tax=Yokenella regensburgei TaxID=158877 RepID=UPI0011BF740B|nr:hypothetical protein [Yokenella regensburgei]KAF1369641.1 hypothetical protein FHR25_001929 [Yokenella regensburgei]MDR3105955.1 hypothetical protein [Yokenella regensburgei]
MRTSAASTTGGKGERKKYRHCDNAQVAYVISSHNNTPRNKTPDGVFIIVSGIRNSASGAEMGKMEIKNKLRRWLARKNNE